MHSKFYLKCEHCYYWDELSHIDKLKMVCPLYKLLESLCHIAIWFWDSIYVLDL